LIGKLLIELYSIQLAHSVLVDAAHPHAEGRSDNRKYDSTGGVGQLCLIRACRLDGIPFNLRASA
jgi:hypothetical protein